MTGKLFQFQTVENVSLHDIRPGTRAIKSLIQRRKFNSDDENELTPIVKFNFKASENAGISNKFS